MPITQRPGTRLLDVLRAYRSPAHRSPDARSPAPPPPTAWPAPTPQTRSPSPTDPGYVTAASGDATSSLGSAARINGSMTRNALPSPGVLETSVRPPWASAIEATIDSPEPGATARAGPRRIGAEEALEHAVEIGGVDAGAFVGDLDHRLLAAATHRYGDGGVGWAVGARVGEQIADGLTQPGVVATDFEVVVGFQRHGAVGFDRPGVGDELLDERGDAPPAPAPAAGPGRAVPAAAGRRQARPCGPIQPRSGASRWPGRPGVRRRHGETARRSRAPTSAESAARARRRPRTGAAGFRRRWRSANASSMWASIAFSAIPRRPTSVRGSVCSTRRDRSPAAISPAVASIRTSGRMPTPIRCVGQDADEGEYDHADHDLILGQFRDRRVDVAEWGSRHCAYRVERCRRGQHPVPPGAGIAFRRGAEGCALTVGQVDPAVENASTLSDVGPERAAGQDASVDYSRGPLLRRRELLVEPIEHERLEVVVRRHRRGDQPEARRAAR